ncbi:MAG TPA: hypothetical protein VIC62_05400 [Nakamurella sp.]|jgi:hypothetical protein
MSDHPHSVAPDALDRSTDTALARLEASLAALSAASADLDGLDEADDYAWDFHRGRALSAQDTLRSHLGTPTTPEVVAAQRQQWLNRNLTHLPKAG